MNIPRHDIIFWTGIFGAVVGWVILATGKDAFPLLGRMEWLGGWFTFGVLMGWSWTERESSRSRQ